MLQWCNSGLTQRARRLEGAANRSFFLLCTHVHNRKNYLFAGSDAGGERAAAIYTLVQTAKLNGLNLETYLQDILAKIAMGRPSIASTNWCPGV
jgi:transposase